MARSADALSYAWTIVYVYLPGIPFGVLSPDDSAMSEMEAALRIAERSGDDLTLSNARLTLAHALVHRPTDTERDRGQNLLTEVSNELLRQGHNLCDQPIVNVYLARERARREVAMTPSPSCASP